MTKLKITKRIVAGMLMLSMTCVSLTGCEDKTKKEDTTPAEAFEGVPSDTKVMVIGEYDVYLDELLVYAFQNLYLRGSSVENWSDEADISAKKEVLSSIRETKILYDVATKNDCTLDESDMEVVETTSDNFINTFGTDLLDEYGISDEVVKSVFAEQAMVSKFETEIKNDMGKKINADVMEGFVDYSFNTIYYMVFPTIAQDDAGDPMVNEDGSYVELSDEEKEAAKADAEAAIEELRGGADYLETAEKYGITDFCTETSGYIGSYSDELNEALEGMKNGECTDIMEGTMGYIVVYMISADDETLKENYVYYLAKDYTDDEFDTLRNNWLATIEIDPEGDMEGTVWEDYPLINIVDEFDKKAAETDTQQE